MKERVRGENRDKAVEVYPAVPLSKLEYAAWL